MLADRPAGGMPNHDIAAECQSEAGAHSADAEIDVTSGTEPSIEGTYLLEDLASSEHVRRRSEAVLMDVLLLGEGMLLLI